MSSMRTVAVPAFLLLAVVVIAPPGAPAQAGGDEAYFVTFELGEILAKSPVTGVLRVRFEGSSADVPLSARAGEPLQGSVSVPVATSTGAWEIDLSTLEGAPLMLVAGELSGTGIRILESRVDGGRIDLPRDTTSLRVIKGYVTATVTLLGQLKDAGCCAATLGIDANADGEISTAETRVVNASGLEVRATMEIPRAAPSVAYVFTITSGTGKTAARASGTYSFTKMNGVSANGEFDPEVVEFVTGSVERSPNLLHHDIGSGLLLQTVSGSERAEEGPRVFFTMGTPGATIVREPPADPAGRSADPAEAAPAPAANGEPAAPIRPVEIAAATLGALLTSSLFLAILLGSIAAALLAIAARRLIEKRSY